MATTKTDPKSAAVSERDVKKAGKTYEGLSRDQLIEAYRHMYTSRRVDDHEILLKAPAEDLLPDLRRRT